ncbi:Pycsar system effector family protein [Flavobacterium selenitireducens]|uniref:Pycsar system effector family protein n=1 Tax=Flavobacterium selenitireducens TaxID=2722704 RepID=UPI00168BA15B|nr:Pycsar system effector family protein [Flavobacterium selenitireducens]MBD3583344.1 HD domain-containing protein [Flavobacterium selenitireducens]
MTLPETAEKFVRNLLKDKLSDSYTYHNFEHTKRVVASALELAESEVLSDEERSALELAAWFHDTGYINGPDKHENNSALIFNEFASENRVPPQTAALAEKLIRITEMCLEPDTTPEKIIRDADCSHFGSEKYQKIASLLREEWASQGRVYSDSEWAKGNLEMLTKWHKFHTDYARNHWQSQKEKNIASIQQKLKEMESEENPGNEKKKDKKKPDRGVETLFRVTLNNHTQLSQIADSKANILLSVNAIIISIALSTLIPKLDSPSNAHLVTPTFIMLMFSVISIIFAILATRPKVSSATYNPQDVANRKINLLFFGNFSKMPLADYQNAMKEMMDDRNYLYESLIKDLYLLGTVLERKYKLLRITYNIFMFGIISSVVAFVVAFKSY